MAKKMLEIIYGHSPVLGFIYLKYLKVCTTTYIITFQDKKFHVHQIILSERSEFFDAMFRSELFESKTNSLEIPDAEPKVTIG